MKKLLHLVLIIMVGVLVAQTPLVAPNAGFETWASDFASEADPTSWVTVNLAKNPLLDPDNPISAFQETTDVADGSVTLKIVTVDLLTNPYPDYIPWTGGIAAIAELVFVPDTKVVPGFTVSNFKPTAFSYKGKYSPSGVDTAFALVYLTRFNTTTNKKDTIAYALDTMHTTAAYETRTINFTYIPAFDGIDADTCMVTFSSSSIESPQVGSAFYVDKVEFAFPSATNAAFGGDGFMLYPNPTQDKLYIGGANRNAASVNVFRADGMLLKSKILSTNDYIETSGMAPGMYSIQILNADGVVISTRKISVNK